MLSPRCPYEFFEPNQLRGALFACEAQFDRISICFPWGHTIVWAFHTLSASGEGGVAELLWFEGSSDGASPDAGHELWDGMHRDEISGGVSEA